MHEMELTPYQILTTKGACALLAHVPVTVSISKAHLRSFVLNPCYEGCYPMMKKQDNPGTHKGSLIPAIASHTTAL